MAFNSDEFLLKEFTIKTCVIPDPENIGTDGVDPRTKCGSQVILGYTQQGSITLPMLREYATFMAQTPGIKVRQDLTLKSFSLEGMLGQWDADSITLLKNLLTQKAYPITAPAIGVQDIFHIGSDEQVTAATSLLLETQLTNGDPFYVIMYAARFLSEDNTIALSGTEHATQAFTAESFVHPNFTTSGVDAQKHYGMMSHVVS